MNAANSEASGKAGGEPSDPDPPLGARPEPHVLAVLKRYSLEELQQRLKLRALLRIRKSYPWLLKAGHRNEPLVNADDFANDVLCQVLENKRRWNPADCPDFLWWLARAVDSHVWNYVKTRERHVAKLHALAKITPVATPDDAIVDECVGRDLRDFLGNILTPPLSDLIPFLFGEESAKAAAERLGVPLQRIYRMKDQVRREFERAQQRQEGARYVAR